MRKLITFICLIGCFYSASLTAQCETNLVATVAECLPNNDNGWFFTLNVQAPNASPGSDVGWTAPQLDAAVLQPFNQFVTIGPFSTPDSVEIIPTYFGIDGCDGESIVMNSPSCFLGDGTNCLVSAEVVGTNCGIIAPGFTFTVEITSNSPTATGWTSPEEGYVEEQGFGIFDFGPYDDSFVNIEVRIQGDTECSIIGLSVDNPCNICPLELFAQDSLPSTCGQQDGVIQLLVAGNEGDYQVSYEGDNGQSGSVTNIDFIDGLGAGCYNLELSDATDFCTATFSVCIPDFSDISIQTSVEIDNGDAFITANVTGGTPPYFYQWNTGETTPVVGPVPPGIYSLTVFDVNGCSQTQDVIVETANVILETGPTAVTNASCGQNDGAIEPEIFGGTPPFVFQWSTGATTPTIAGLQPGVYTLTVTDANNSFAIGNYLVLEEAGFVIDIEGDSPFPSICSPGETQTLIAIVNGSENTPGFLFEWTDQNGTVLATTQSFTVTEPGFYALSVTTDPASDCREVDRIIVAGGQSDEDALEINFFAVDSLDGFCDVFLSATYDNFSISADWTLPNGDQITSTSISAQNYGPGIYSVTIYPPAGTCPFTDTVLVTPEDLTCVSLSGTVYLDENDDCATTGIETTMSSQLVQLTSVANSDRVYYAYTNQAGDWTITIPEGTYSVVAVEPNELFQACPAQTVTVQTGVVADLVNLVLSPLASCPRVTVDLSIARIRRCFDSPVYIYYENTGTAVSENTVVSVEFGDWIDEVNPGFGPQPTSITTDPITGVITAAWNIGDLAPFSGGTLSVMAYTCNNDFPIMSAACVTATVSPNSPCPPADDNWTGASVLVEGECQGDNVVFRMSNVGTGDMSIGLQYVVVEDGVIIRPNEQDDPLTAGSEFEFVLPANGSTYHVQATQEPLHPGLLRPIDFVEGCGTGATSTGFALQFPVSDDAYWIDEDCQEIIGAYDPNDKMAEPKGYADQNYIVTDQPIDYQIRFQNTGNDTAFTVIVRDTISELLDLSTFQLLSTTHDVKVSIDSSNAIAFIFNDIMLPDSFVNEPASNGAISYRILPVADLEPGTEIENTAHIYFDFNEAIVTNTYRHTIEEDFVAVSVFDFNPVIERLSVYPNPTAGLAHIQLPEALEGETLELDVIDALGRVLQRYTYTNGERPDANLAGLPAGWYTLRLTNGNTTVGTGRVLLEN